MRWNGGSSAPRATRLLPLRSDDVSGDVWVGEGPTPRLAREERTRRNAENGAGHHAIKISRNTGNLPKDQERNFSLSARSPLSVAGICFMLPAGTGIFARSLSLDSGVLRPVLLSAIIGFCLLLPFSEFKNKNVGNSTGSSNTGKDNNFQSRKTSEEGSAERLRIGRERQCKKIK